MYDSLEVKFHDLIPATVISRPNRFIVHVEVGAEAEDGAEGGARETIAHLADPGRLTEAIFPGNRVMVRKAHPGAGRKTALDLVLADSGNRSESGETCWVSVDTRQPNRLFGQALVSRAIPEFSQYTGVRPEHSLKHESGRFGEAGKRTPVTRVDFLLSGPGLPPTLVEVKSVTLAQGEIGLFPDAPTERGVRHLRSLSESVSRGYRACAVFVAQRHDIRVVKPNAQVDGRFARALADARSAGVELFGYRCAVWTGGTRLNPEAIPVEAG